LIRSGRRSLVCNVSFHTFCLRFATRGSATAPLFVHQLGLTAPPSGAAQPVHTGNPRRRVRRAIAAVGVGRSRAGGHGVSKCPADRTVLGARGVGKTYRKRPVVRNISLYGNPRRIERCEPVVHSRQLFPAEWNGFYPGDLATTPVRGHLASCSRRTPMICSSVNRLRFIRPLPPQVTDSTSSWKSFRGSGHSAAWSEFIHHYTGLPQSTNFQRGAPSCNRVSESSMANHFCLRDVLAAAVRFFACWWGGRISRGIYPWL
jgi:hypothetical protein